MDRVIAIHHADPGARVESGTEYEKSMTRVMELAERQVRWCDPRLADRLKREL